MEPPYYKDIVQIYRLINAIRGFIDEATNEVAPDLLEKLKIIDIEIIKELNRLKDKQ